MAVILAIDLGKYKSTARRRDPLRTVVDDGEPPHNFSQLQAPRLRQRLAARRRQDRMAKQTL